MKVLLVILIIILTSSSLLSQQSKPSISLNQLTDSIRSSMERNHIAGLMLGITTKDSVIFSGGFGYADIENKRNIDESTLFRMGSITKMFVSMGIMKLVEQGKINVDDRLKDVAPEVPFQNKWESSHPLKIVHLLEHTSGFDDIKLNRMYSLDSADNKGIDMVLVQQPSMVTRWKPGERTAYSNPNYAILGYILQKLSDKPYDQFLKDTILEPLGMYQSNFNTRSKYPDKDVKEYTFKNGQLKQVPSSTLISGAYGALWSSANDMTKFIQLFLRNGQPLFSEDFIMEFETPRSSLAARAGLKTPYALGNYSRFLAKKFSFRGHDGILGACFSSCFYNRNMNIGFVISSNSDRIHTEIEEHVIAFIEQKLPNQKIATQPLDKEGIQPFLGLYQFDSPRNEIAAFLDKFQNLQQVLIKQDDLYIKPWLGQPSKLVQTAPLTFTYEGLNSPLIIFTKNERATVMSVAGTYYERTSSFESLAKRWCFVVALITALSSIVLGAVSFTKATIGKVRWKDIPIRMLPLVSIPPFIWAILYLLDMKEHSYKLYQLATVNGHTVAVFLSTAFFGIASLLFFIYAILQFQKLPNRWLAYYMVAAGLSLCVITFVLFQAGWIGIRTWAM
jgi:CubicO group peptidase (beta-lactamase class C family)